MIKIKNEYLDSKIYCPATRREVYVRFIEKDMYNYYYNNGYKIIFEVEAQVDENLVVKDKLKK
jgi:hypothetical protein